MLWLDDVFCLPVILDVSYSENNLFDDREPALAEHGCADQVSGLDDAFIIARPPDQTRPITNRAKSSANRHFASVPMAKINSCKPSRCSARI